MFLNNWGTDPQIFTRRFLSKVAGHVIETATYPRAEGGHSSDCGRAVFVFEEFLDNFHIWSPVCFVLSQGGFFKIPTLRTIIQ